MLLYILINKDAKYEDHYYCRVVRKGREYNTSPISPQKTEMNEILEAKHKKRLVFYIKMLRFVVVSSIHSFFFFFIAKYFFVVITRSIYIHLKLCRSKTDFFSSLSVKTICIRHVSLDSRIQKTEAGERSV